MKLRNGPMIPNHTEGCQMMPDVSIDKTVYKTVENPRHGWNGNKLAASPRKP